MQTISLPKYDTKYDTNHITFTEKWSYINTFNYFKEISVAITPYDANVGMLMHQANVFEWHANGPFLHEYVHSFLIGLYYYYYWLVLSASTTFCGTEFHKLIVFCVEKMICFVHLKTAIVCPPV